MDRRAAYDRLNLMEVWLPAGSSNRPGGVWAKTSVTVHTTGNSRPGADALAHALYMDSPAARRRRVSWHYSVDSERVVKHLPILERSWHTSHRTANAHSISVEICENADGDFAAACDRAALLVALLLAETGVAEVTTHQRWTGKFCPARLLGEKGGFAAFLARCLAYRARLT
jgi:N-acetylmuramoyl-L-alanine amidase